MNNDVINACIQMGAGFFVWRNVVQLWRDKRVAGVYLPTTLFFIGVGVWGLVFMSSLDQWLSVGSTAFITAGNITWLLLAMHYKKETHGNHKSTAEAA